MLNHGMISISVGTINVAKMPIKMIVLPGKVNLFSV